MEKIVSFDVYRSTIHLQNLFHFAFEITSQMLLVRRKTRKRSAGDKYREELRQVRNSGSRVGPRGWLLARAHETRSRSSCTDYP